MPDQKQKLVKVDGLGIVAFPDDIPEDQIIATIRGHLDSPEHKAKTHAASPHFAGIDTEQSERSRQTKTGKSLKDFAGEVVRSQTTPLISEPSADTKSIMDFIGANVLTGVGNPSLPGVHVSEHDQKLSRDIGAGITEGVTEEARQMTSPLSIELIAAGPLLGKAGRLMGLAPKAVTAISKSLSALFAVQQANGAYKTAHDAYKAYLEGNNKEAASLATQTLFGLGMAGAAAAHVVEGARLPEGAKRVNAQGDVLPPEKAAPGLNPPRAPGPVIEGQVIPNRTPVPVGVQQLKVESEALAPADSMVNRNIIHRIPETPRSEVDKTRNSIAAVVQQLEKSGPPPMEPVDESTPQAIKEWGDRHATWLKQAQPFLNQYKALARQYDYQTNRDIGHVRMLGGQPIVYMTPRGFQDLEAAISHSPDANFTTSGISIPKRAVPMLIHNAEVRHLPFRKELAELMEKGADKNGNVTMSVIPQNGESLNTAMQRLREELNHTWQKAWSDSAHNHLDPTELTKLNGSMPEAIQDHLYEYNYPANDGNHDNTRQRVLEATSKLMSIPPVELGVPDVEAAQYLTSYFDMVTKKHGDKALDELIHTTQFARNVKGGFKDAVANGRADQRTVPSVQAEGAGGGAGGVAAPQPGAPQQAEQPTTPTSAASLEELKKEAAARAPKPTQESDWLQSGTQRFAEQQGRTTGLPTYLTPDVRAQEIADAYSEMQHNPSDPLVKASYAAMKADIDKQWDHAAREMGITFEPWNKPGQPYQNSAEMSAAVQNNKHLYFFQGGDMPSDHPLAERTGPLNYNDKLRAVHDLFGHAVGKFQFGPRGEENAWAAHSQMFSSGALPALTSETKGQNSWVNSGPHMRDANGDLVEQGSPGWMSPQQRPFAEQKAGLLPERFHYRTDNPISFLSPNTLDLSLSEAQQRISSAIHKRFSGMARDLGSALGLQPSVRPVLGAWQGGAENSTIHQFPIGTDPDLVRYYNAILGKLGYQNSTAAFFPGEGSDKLYAFWTDGHDTSSVAKALLDNGLENSTIEPAEAGHVVYLVGSGDDFQGKVDRVTDALGVKGHVEEYAGRAELPGNYHSRDAAAREFSSAAEALESRHPEWKQIREGFESRPDIVALHDLIGSTKDLTPEPQIDVVHYSNAPDIERLDPSRYGQNKTHDVSRSVVNRPDMERKESFPKYWTPETYVGEESSPQFHSKAAERFAARQFTYKGKVGAHSIYDLSTDPDKILALSRKELEARNLKRLGVRLLPSDAEVNAYAIKRLKDLGYSGRRDVDGLIASWEEIPVTNANIPPAEDISRHLAAEDILFRRESLRTWKDVSKHLSAEEKERYDTKEKRAKIVAAVNAMPNAEEWDAAVKAGISGSMWYDRSSRAFDALVESQPDMFRKSDKNKFLNFVSALSPVQPVRQNLLMAVNLWDKWNKAGRPVDVIWTDTKNFKGVANKNSSLFRILKGRGNSFGVDLPSRLYNGIRALQDQPMSGPKVSAFAPNLGKDTNKSTNDTWMAIFGDTDPSRISDTHLYDAMTSLVRQAADKNGLNTRQSQAAIWSFIKSLAELSGWGKDRWIPPQEIVKQGLLTPELINQHAADFADLLANDPEIRNRIKDIGGDLDALDKKLGKYVPDRPEQTSIAHVDPRLLNAAERLEAARQNAKIQAHLASKSDSGPKLFDTSFDSSTMGDITFNRSKADTSLDALKAEAEARRPERRRNQGLRKRIDEMTPEEMKALLLRSETTDLPNSRSFYEAERDKPSAAVAMSDADGLKAFNDKFGYDAGDALLRAKADALKQAGLDAYHDKGDEFMYRGESPEDLKTKLEKARDILRNTEFDVVMDDGSKLKLKGVDFSYGIGRNLDEAERGQHTHKSEREASGERGPRGQFGRITEVQREGTEYPGVEASQIEKLKEEARARDPRNTGAPRVSEIMKDVHERSPSVIP